MGHGGSVLVTHDKWFVFGMRAAKFDQPTSRIDFCGSPSFPVEMEIRKLPIA